MRQERLALRGMLCFENTLEIDFRELPSGLIAVIGPNGHGKTTTLESPLAGVYRNFFSREGSLVDYATSRDSFIESQFSLDGRGTFRTRVAIDGVKRGMDAVIEQILPDGERRVLNDGKVTTFDEHVARLFPSRTLLMASAVICQSRKGNLADLPVNKRKEVFAEFIGLGHYQQMADTAKAAAGIVDGGRGRLMAVRETLARDTAPALAEEIRTAHEALDVEGVQRTKQRDQLDEEITRLDEELATVQGMAAQHQAAVAKRDASKVAAETAQRDQQRAEQDLETAQREHTDTIAAIEHRLSAAVASINAQLTDGTPLNNEIAKIDADLKKELDRLQAAEADRSALARELASIDDNLAKQLKDIDERVANNRAVLARADEIRQAAKDKAETETEIAKWRERAAGLRDGLTALNVASLGIFERLAAVQRAEEELQRLERAVETLAGVPCGGEIIGCPECGIKDCSRCRYTVDAKADEERIPALRDTVATKATIEAEKVDNDRAIESRTLEIADVDRQVALFEQTIKKLAPVAALLPNIETAEERITGLKAQRTACQDDAEHRRAEAERRADERIAELRRQQQAAGERADAARIDAAIRESDRKTALELQKIQTVEDANTATTEAHSRIAKRRGELEAQIREHGARACTAKSEYEAADREAQDTAASAVRARDIEGELAGVRRRREDTIAALARIEAQLADVSRRRQQYETRRKELAHIEERVRTLESDLIEWNLLAKALGKDGLQKLEIDIAGPTVAAYCNQLMAECIGPRFTLDLVTQEAKADGKGMRETFTIHVYDNERGGEPRDISDLSGGEKVIVSEALANAIALAVNARNQMPIRTCWRDETTGALDAENAIRYIAMLRKVREIGGFEQVIFITHNSDCAALADAQIYVHDGKAETMLPPYVYRPPLPAARNDSRSQVA